MDNWLQAISGENQLAKVISTNEYTKKYGLILDEKDAQLLLAERQDVLKSQQRVEFGKGILPELIFAFCDSQYIYQDNYVDVMGAVQDIFYTYKNEAQDELTDTELIDFMRRQFDEVCFGDVEYLKGTCLERFARAIRSGYKCNMQNRLRDEYTLRDVENEYGKLEEETRWEYELYKQRLEDTY